MVIPAHQARATLGDALASVAVSGLPVGQLEVVIAPDDGDSYDDVPDFGMQLTRCAAHHIATGAGAARNRALACAQAPYIAFLDADDTWAPDYLSALLPLARRAGAAFGQTSVLRDEDALMMLPGIDRDILEFSDFARTGAVTIRWCGVILPDPSVPCRRRT